MNSIFNWNKDIHTSDSKYVWSSYFESSEINDWEFVVNAEWWSSKYFDNLIKMCRKQVFILNIQNSFALGARNEIRPHVKMINVFLNSQYLGYQLNKQLMFLFRTKHAECINNDFFFLNLSKIFVIIVIMIRFIRSFSLQNINKLTVERRELLWFKF